MLSSGPQLMLSILAKDERTHDILTAGDADQCKIKYVLETQESLQWEGSGKCATARGQGLTSNSFL